jgi:hypothetical protein
MARMGKKPPRSNGAASDSATGRLTALCVGGGCRQPQRRQHRTRTPKRDGAQYVARRVAQSKGNAAILLVIQGNGPYEQPHALSR